MIIDIMQLFKSDLTQEQLHRNPVCFLDIRTIRMVAVRKDVNEGPLLFIDNLPIKMQSIKAAVDAARQIVDLISEARETDRLDIASVHASQAGKAMKEVIQEVSDED